MSLAIGYRLGTPRPKAGGLGSYVSASYDSYTAGNPMGCSGDEGVGWPPCHQDALVSIV